MKYTKFTIENFKGISKVEIDFKKNRIITLVGLNESGKTTIMEAISFLFNLFRNRPLTDEDKNVIRPKGSDFTGRIRLIAEVELEEQDKLEISGQIKSEKNAWKVVIPDNLEYEWRFVYKLHTFVKDERFANFPIKVSGANESGGSIKGLLYNIDKPLWQEAVNLMKSKLMPEILYYEDFIFDIPQEVYFNMGATDPNLMAKIESVKNVQWQGVISDVLLASNKKFNSFQNFVADIWEKDNETALNRISDMEEVLNKKITQSWKELFQKNSKKLNFKEIKIYTRNENECLALSFRVKTDNGKLFYINDRSKGCRWFFSFLIFTEFRKSRTKNILFLLDEPASNLHLSAQQKIMEALYELSKDSMVIYSTHSHHLIDPKILSGAYVVVNESLNDKKLEGDMSFDDSVKITAYKYFDYIGRGLGKVKVSYYQPILDSLDYKPSAVEPIPNIVIL